MKGVKKIMNTAIVKKGFGRLSTPFTKYSKADTNKSKYRVNCLIISSFNQ